MSDIVCMLACTHTHKHAHAHAQELRLQQVEAAVTSKADQDGTEQRLQRLEDAVRVRGCVSVCMCCVRMCVCVCVCESERGE